MCYTKIIDFYINFLQKKTVHNFSYQNLYYLLSLRKQILHYRDGRMLAISFHCKNNSLEVHYFANFLLFWMLHHSTTSVWYIYTYIFIRALWMVWGPSNFFVWNEPCLHYFLKLHKFRTFSQFKLRIPNLTEKYWNNDPLTFLYFGFVTFQNKKFQFKCGNRCRFADSVVFFIREPFENWREPTLIFCNEVHEARLDAMRCDRPTSQRRRYIITTKRTAAHSTTFLN